ncbi:MAG: hypothetical protein K6A38_10110 [Lachnospiraceae bacterium]|nr:hypothetical protein [Lachnospiraceae bacterium]
MINYVGKMSRGDALSLSKKLFEGKVIQTYRYDLYWVLEREYVKNGGWESKLDDNQIGCFMSDLVKLYKKDPDIVFTSSGHSYDGRGAVYQIDFRKMQIKSVNYTPELLTLDSVETNMHGNRENNPGEMVIPFNKIDQRASNNNINTSKYVFEESLYHEALKNLLKMAVINNCRMNDYQKRCAMENIDRAAKQAEWITNLLKSGGYLT